MTAAVGELLRDWRKRRRLSQLDLSNQATVSARHLSFVETGRSKPSRELVLHLAEHLDVPLRERNALLHAAGYAPVYRETPMDDIDMAPVRTAIETVLHAMDRRGTTIAQLWCLEENHRARRLYEYLGWRATRDRQSAPWPPHPTEMRYTRLIPQSER